MRDDAFWPLYVNIETASSWTDVLPDENRNQEPPERTRRLSVPLQWLLKDSTGDLAQDKESKATSMVSENLWRLLDRDGFVVVDGVLTSSECRDAIDLAWDWIEAASVAEYSVKTTRERELVDVSEVKKLSLPSSSPVSRMDASTLSSNFFPQSVEGGIMPFYASGHSSFAWMLRSHPNVKAIFAALYRTDDLITSLDGIILWPSRRPTDKPFTDAGWFHLDQNPKYNANSRSVQGLVNLLPVNRTTGGNVLLENSHLLFPQHYLEDDPSLFYADRLSDIGTDDWLEIDPNDKDLFSKTSPLCRVLCLQLRPGDVLLWDSRVVHCSYPSREECVETEGFPTHSSGLTRAASLVTMIPSDQAPDEILRERRAAVESQRTLTHWANKVVPLGHEQIEQMRIEHFRVAIMNEWRQRKSLRPSLYQWRDLNQDQRCLVVGNSMARS